MKIAIPRIDRISDGLKGLLARLSIYAMFLLFTIVLSFLLAEVVRQASPWHKKDKALRLKNNPSKENPNIARYNSFVEEVVPKMALGLSKISIRDVFSRWEASPGELTGLSLVSIETDRIPIVYKGYINFDDGFFIAQINKFDKTFFLKTGASFEDLEVQDISEERVILKGRNGKELVLEKLKPIYKKERVAIVADKDGEARYRTFRGDILKDYRVERVGKDKVLLANRINGKKFTLEMKR